MNVSIGLATASGRLGRRGVTTLAIVLAVTVAGTAAALLSSRSHGPGQSQDRAADHAMPTGVDLAADVRASAQAKADVAADTLRRYAVNLLLLPLLDDDLPPRWADPAPEFTCLDPGRARVGGQPIVAGTRLPGGAFVIEGGLSCPLLATGDLDATGRVTLRVFPDDVFGLTAIVELHGVRVRSPRGATVVLEERFVAGETSMREPVGPYPAR